MSKGVDLEHYAPFQKIREAATITGLSQYFLRQGLKAGTIPHVMSGTTYLINVPALMAKLERESKGA